MNINQVIAAAREAISATGAEVKTISRGDDELILGVRYKKWQRVFGPATPLVCWTQAYEYATKNNWVSLLTHWRKPAAQATKKVPHSNRGELMLIAGSALQVEQELKQLDATGQLLSAVYTRRGQRQIIAHAEVI
jgi:hypothetical protein